MGRLARCVSSIGGGGRLYAWWCFSGCKLIGVSDLFSYRLCRIFSWSELMLVASFYYVQTSPFKKFVIHGYKTFYEQDPPAFRFGH